MWQQGKERKESYAVRRVVGLHTGSVEEEAYTGRTLALTLAESVHQLLQLRRTLDFEEHLVVVIGNLDVEVFRLASLRLGSRRGRFSGVRHVEYIEGFRYERSSRAELSRDR
jgi:hypothetical protein